MAKASRRVGSLLFALAATLLASTAWSAEGVIEINAAAAGAGGITPDDTPGYPVTISEAGSYRLTGPLATNNRATSLIHVTTADVEVDLNGFRVSYCQSGLFCVGGDAAAIRIESPDAQIRNGVIRGAGGNGVQGGARIVLEDLRIADSGLRGVSVSSYSRVRNVNVSGSGTDGIFVGFASKIQDCVIESSGQFGVELAFGALVTGSVIANNQGAINASSSGGGVAGGYANNQIVGNGNLAEVQPILNTMRDLGGNLCGSDTICP